MSVALTPRIMGMGTLGRVTCVLGLAAAVGATGCFFSEDEGAESSRDGVTGGGDTSAVLKSTLLLETGCTAAKVGPRHLLVAARCVMNNPAFAAGKKVAYKIAASTEEREEPDTLAPLDGPPKDSGAPKDSGTSKDSGTTKDGGASDAGGTKVVGPAIEIEEVKVNASFEAKCADDACEFTRLAASDAKDVAVIIATADLETIPTIPIDLDSINDGDPLRAVGSGCDRFDGTPKITRTSKVVAVPAKMVNHRGSPYLTKPQFVSRLNAGYVVTPGPGWQKQNAPRICKTDIGAPLFRANVSAIVGVTSNFTSWEEGKLVPVTVHSTKVDTASRVGSWLESLGVETIHSCSESAGGCVKSAYDGGSPEAPGTGPGSTTQPGDAGEGDAIAPETDGGAPDASEPVDPPPSGETSLPDYPNDETSSSSGDDDDYADAAIPKKKKAKDNGGCSAAPGSSPMGGAPIFLGLAAAAVFARRRRNK